jgi:hypothetical protein
MLREFENPGFVRILLLLALALAGAILMVTLSSSLLRTAMAGL